MGLQRRGNQRLELVHTVLWVHYSRSPGRRVSPSVVTTSRMGFGLRKQSSNLSALQNFHQKNFLFFHQFHPPFTDKASPPALLQCRHGGVVAAEPVASVSRKEAWA